MLKKSLLVMLAASLCGLMLFVAGCGELGNKATNSAGPINDEFGMSAMDGTYIVELDSLENFQPPSQPLAAGNAWWWYVNQAIWYRAHRDIGRNVNKECKPWANDVVRDVTGFSLPSTQSNWIYLNSGHAIKIVDGHVAGGGTIERGIGLGNIIQMHIIGGRTNSPHTAFFYRYVTRYGKPGMYWIESNVLAKNTVYVRFVSFDWFRSRVATRYSIYQATNW